MVKRNRDNCVFELKKKPLGKTSPPSEGLGEAFSRIKETPFSNQERRFFLLKRGFPYNEERLSLFLPVIYLY